MRFVQVLSDLSNSLEAAFMVEPFVEQNISEKLAIASTQAFYSWLCAEECQ